jgi:hypothetical protein
MQVFCPHCRRRVLGRLVEGSGELLVVERPPVVRRQRGERIKRLGGMLSLASLCLAVGFWAGKQWVWWQSRQRLDEIRRELPRQLREETRRLQDENE